MIKRLICYFLGHDFSESWYDLHGLTGMTCTKCGKYFPVETKK